MEKNQLDHYISYGKYQEALEILNLIQRDGILSDDEYLKKLYVQIFICLDNGEFHKGRELADKMIEESRKRGNILMEIDALIGMIENNSSLTMFNEAFELIDKAQILLKKIDDKLIKQMKKRQAYIFFLKGKIYRDLHDIVKAIELFKKSYELRKEINDRFGMIWSLSNLGVSSTTIGDFKVAEKSLKRSISIAKDLDAWVGIVWNLIHFGWVKYHLRDLNTAISSAKECFSICKSKNMVSPMSHCYDLLGHCSLVKGNLKESLSYFEKSLNIKLEKGQYNLLPYSYYYIGVVFSQKGEFKQSLEYFNKILEIKNVEIGKMFKPMYLNALGKVYGELGKFKLANQYLLEALDILKKNKTTHFKFLNFNLSSTKILHNLIILSVNNNDVEKLNFYLDKLYQKSLENPNIKQIDQLYRLDKGIILKLSNFLMDKIEAEEIFNEIIEEQLVDHDIVVEAMKNLCELYIYELELTGEEQILQEIEELSTRLLKIAESEHLYDLLAETFFFKAKISLLNLDIKNARLLLIKAQNTASEHELKRLANKISNEHDSLLMKLDDWEKKIEKNISLKERLHDSKLEFLISKKPNSNSNEIKNKSDIPVYFIIISTINAECIYNRAFGDIKIDDGSLIAGYISAINIFGKEAFSSKGSIDRIKHGDYITILQLQKEYLFGYVFKGYSYSAISKLNEFIKSLSQLNYNFDNLILDYEKNLKLPEEIHTTIENLADKIFLSSKII
ncbi:MAG: tetratricopeptide repeat protein [Candidatus Lokiarchaeota archaeon]|nr:tetratricopeptide repeat protein [Candidatus Lokiarchaeota archaeon]